MRMKYKALNKFLIWIFGAWSLSYIIFSTLNLVVSLKIINYSLWTNGTFYFLNLLFQFVLLGSLLWNSIKQKTNSPMIMLINWLLSALFAVFMIFYAIYASDTYLLNFAPFFFRVSYIIINLLFFISWSIKLIEQDKRSWALNFWIITFLSLFVITNVFIILILQIPLDSQRLGSLSYNVFIFISNLVVFVPLISLITFKQLSFNS